MLRQFSSPYQILSGLEWVLLVATISFSILVSSFEPSLSFPYLTAICLSGLALMGLKLPRGRLHQKLVYILVALGLIFLPLLRGEIIPTFPVIGIAIVIRSFRMFELKGRLTVAGIISGLVILKIFFSQAPALGFMAYFLNEVCMEELFQGDEYRAFYLKIMFLIYYTLMMSFIMLMCQSMISASESKQKLSVALAQLRQYAVKVEERSALEERNRIARDIHDALGHTLVAQSIQLNSGLLLLQSNQIEEATSFLKQSKALCAQALQEVRQSVATFRDNFLFEQSLEEIITILIKNVRVTTPINPQWKIQVSHPISVPIKVAVYRLVQEALTNIIRHSQATEVMVEIISSEHRLYILIKDNGKGFNIGQKSKGFGLQGMRERILNLDGQFNIISQPNLGCSICVQIPLLE